jgi:hypothetical protein
MATGVERGWIRNARPEQRHPEDPCFPRLVKYGLVSLFAHRSEAVHATNIVNAIHIPIRAKARKAIG